jgi:hypothetical protein
MVQYIDILERPFFAARYFIYPDIHGHTLWILRSNQGYLPHGKDKQREQKCGSNKE